MNEYSQEIEKVDGYTNDKKQEEYYNRICSFLQSDYHVLVNPGGMGLGKTFASTLALKRNLTPFEFAFIGCPTAPLKSVWCNDMNKCSMKTEYMIWFAKNDCCIKKQQNYKFDTKN